MRISNAAVQFGLLLVGSCILVGLPDSSGGQIASPPLHIAPTNGGAVLSWPAGATNFVLQRATSLAAGTAWTNVPTSPNFAGEAQSLLVFATNDARYFRLKGPAVASLRLFQLAVYYNGFVENRPLEFTYSGPLVIHGRVHANGPIYLGSPWSLTFYDSVTTVGTITRPAWAGHGSGEYSGAVIYYGNNLTMVAPFYLPLGTNVTPAGAHAAIELPPGNENPNSPVGQGRLYHRAKVVLLVSNLTTTVFIRSAWALLPGTDPFPVTLTSPNDETTLRVTFPFLSLTNTFTDQRENKEILVSQIDMGKFATWAATNSEVLRKLPPESDAWPNVLFIADNRTTPPAQLTAVRIVNGSAPPANGGSGLTVVTPNPLYVLGNYNCPNAAHLGTTNTSDTLPCALLSDALTILSPAWDDALSANLYTERIASTTTINAGVLAGVVYSTGPGLNQYSGGVQNLPRLLEDWSGQALLLNGAIVNLYNSTRATNQYQEAGIYYGEPSRYFSFDPNFAASGKQPPGTWTLTTVFPP